MVAPYLSAFDRADFAQLLAETERAFAADGEHSTTIQKLRDGLTNLNKLDKGLLADAEWVQLVQFVSADDPEKFAVHAKKVIEGLCTAILDEASGKQGAGLNAADVAQSSTNAESLDLVCEELVKMIQEEARQPDGE